MFQYGETNEKDKDKVDTQSLSPSPHLYLRSNRSGIVRWVDLARSYGLILLSQDVALRTKALKIKIEEQRRGRCLNGEEKCWMK